jgi:hypothetical protein
MKCCTRGLVAAACAATVVSVFLVRSASAGSGDESSRDVPPTRAHLADAVRSHQRDPVTLGDRPVAALRLGVGDGSGIAGASYPSQLPAWSREAAVCTWGTQKGATPRGCSKIPTAAERPGAKYWVPVASIGNAPLHAALNKQPSRNRAGDESTEMGPFYGEQARTGSAVVPASDLGQSIVKVVSGNAAPSLAAMGPSAPGAVATGEPLRPTRDGGLADSFGINLPAETAVSEPPAYLMLLAGLGVVGLIFSRRVSHL